MSARTVETSAATAKPTEAINAYANPLLPQRTFACRPSDAAPKRKAPLGTGGVG